MAPGRKKGGVAPKAAVVRREWNVGELVLAKVKGYPPWPAQITNAEERGYSPNPNKIFVSFFGTKQIRFCHYSEVLPFTTRERSTLIGKLQQRNVTAVLSAAIREICRVDDDQRHVVGLVGRAELENALENQQCREDGRPSHVDVKLEITDGERSDDKEDTDLASPSPKSSEEKSVPAVDTKEEIEVKQEIELEREAVSAHPGNDGPPPRLDAGQPAAFPELATVNSMERKSGLADADTGDYFDQVHYYRKKIRKPVVKEEVGKAQDTALVDGKQSAPPTGETATNSSVKAAEQPRRPAFRKAMKRLNQSTEKRTLQPSGGEGNEVVHKLTHGGGQLRKKKKKYKLKRLGSRGRQMAEVMRNHANPGPSKGGVTAGTDSEDDDSRLETPLMKPRKFGRAHFRARTLPADAQSEGTKGHSEGGELCVQNRLLEEPAERTDSPGMTSHPGLAKDGVAVLHASEDNRGQSRLAAGGGSGNNSRREGTFRSKIRAVISDGESDGEVETQSDTRDEDYDNAKNATLMADRKRMHRPTKAHFKTFKKVKTVGITSPKDVSVPARSSDASVKDLKFSDIREKGTSVPPKAAKYRIRSSLPDDEAVLPPSKRWHPAFEANNVSEAQANVKPGDQANNKALDTHEGSEMRLSPADTKASAAKTHRRKGPAPLSKSCSFSKAATFTADVLDSSHLSKLPKVEADAEDFLKEKEGDEKSMKMNRGSSVPATKSSEGVHSTKGLGEKSHTKSSDYRKGHSEKSQGKRGDIKNQSDRSQGKLKTYQARKPVVSPPKPSVGSHTSPEPKRSTETQHLDKTKADGMLRQSLSSVQSSTPKKIAAGTLAEKGRGLPTMPSGDSSKINGVKLEAFTSPVKFRAEAPENKVRQAVEAAKESKQKYMHGESSPSSSLKHLIAAANAKRRQGPIGGDRLGKVVDKAGTTLVSSPSPIRRLRLSSHLPASNEMFHETTPKSSGHVDFMSPADGKVEVNLSDGGRSIGKEKATTAQPSESRDTDNGVGSTEAGVARDTFTGMLETLSRTKESIGRASHHALECVKHGIAEQIVETIVEKLESEPSFHRRVDLFFLVDSITQCSHNSKGAVGAAYPPVVKEALPRLLSAAAPSGSVARENRRQCLKVLKLWSERGILPEADLGHFMTEIEAHNDEKSGGNPRRPSRSERAVDDPLREMDGMFVDEYGSNASFALPGLLIPRMYEDDEEGSDWGKKNDRDVTAPMNIPEKTREDSVPPEPEEADRHHTHVLEEVDGELEMEDVSPSVHDEKEILGSDSIEAEVDVRENSPAASGDGEAPAVSDVSASSVGGSPLPPLPQGTPPPPSDPPPSPPPLPASPPPSPPPLPPSPAASPAEQSPVGSLGNHSQVNLQALQSYTPDQSRQAVITAFTPPAVPPTHSVVPSSYGSSSAYQVSQASVRPSGGNMPSPVMYPSMGLPVSQGPAPLNSLGPPIPYAVSHAKQMTQNATHGHHMLQNPTPLHLPHNAHAQQATTPVALMQNVGPVPTSAVHIAQSSAHAPQTSPHLPQNNHIPQNASLALGSPGFAQRQYMQPRNPPPGAPYTMSLREAVPHRQQPQLVDATQVGADQEKVSPAMRRTSHDSIVDKANESQMAAAGSAGLQAEGHVSGENTGAAQLLSGNSSFIPRDPMYIMTNGMLRPSHATPYSSGSVNMQHPNLSQPFGPPPPFRHSGNVQGNMSMLVPPPFQYNAGLPGTMPQVVTGQQHMLNFRPGGPTPAQWRPS